LEHGFARFEEQAQRWYVVYQLLCGALGLAQSARRRSCNICSMQGNPLPCTYCGCIYMSRSPHKWSTNRCVRPNPRKPRNQCSSRLCHTHLAIPLERATCFHYARSHLPSNSCSTTCGFPPKPRPTQIEFSASELEYKLDILNQKLDKILSELRSHTGE
jgi:hypothetical protein